MQRKAVALLAILALSFVALSINLEFAEAYTGTITYSAGSDTITAIGGTSGTPITFNDLYLADVAGGWGQVHQQSTYQYSFDLACLQIGDGTNSTYFADSGKQITSTVANGYIRVKTSATFTSGTLIDSATKSTKNGCHFLCSINGNNAGFISSYNNDDNAVVNFYSSTITNLISPGNNAAGILGHYHSAGSIVLTAYHCQFYGFANGLRFLKSTSSIYDIVCGGGGQFGSDIYTTDCNALQSFGNTYGYVFSGAGGGTFKNPTATNVTYGFYGYAVTVDGYLINPTFSSWDIYWSGSSTAKVYRQYQFDLCVLNGEITDFVEDANVTLTKDGTQIGTWLTNSSGQIDTQTLTYGFYNQTGGSSIYEGDHPFVLTITHDDWATYTSRFYVTQKTSLYVSMQEIDEATPNNAAMIWGLLALAGAFCFLIIWRVRR